MSIIADDELVNVSAINQYLYCPRRYWYIRFFDTIGMNYPFRDGLIKHQNKSRRGGWIEELYLEDHEIGIKGRIDILAEEDMVPVERKRSNRYYENDVMQLAGYCHLLENATGESVDFGVIYLYGPDRRVRIRYDEQLQREVRQIVDEMRSMSPDKVPPLVDNPNKCEKCSVRSYCMPAETARLEPDKARDTGWEEYTEANR